MWEPVTPDQEAAAEAGRRAVLANDPYLDEPGLLSRLGNWLLDRFDGVDAPNVDRGWITDVLQTLDALAPWVLAVLSLAVAWWIWHNRSAVALARRARNDGVRVDHHGSQQSASQWLTESRRLAVDGEYAAAVRAAYRAIVVHLVDDELVPPTPGLTVGDHRGMVSRSEVIDALQAEGFATASDIFERAWYGASDDVLDGGDVEHREGRTRVVVAPVTAADVDVVVAAAIRLGVAE